MIVLHQRGALSCAEWPQATVLTAWPAVSELERPELGYTKVPIKAVAIQNFSRELVEAAAPAGSRCQLGTPHCPLFSPRAARIPRRPHAQADARDFDFHEDVLPAEAAAILYGEVVWQATSGDGDLGQAHQFACRRPDPRADRSSPESLL